MCLFRTGKNLATTGLRLRATAKEVAKAVMAAPVPAGVAAAVPTAAATVLAVLYPVISGLAKTPGGRVAAVRDKPEGRVLSEVGLTPSEGEGLGVSDRDAAVAKEAGLTLEVGP